MENNTPDVVAEVAPESVMTSEEQDKFFEQQELVRRYNERLNQMNRKDRKRHESIVRKLTKKQFRKMKEEAKQHVS